MSLVLPNGWWTGGEAVIRVRRVKTGPMQIEGEITADLGWSQITQTYSVPQAPKSWPRKLSAFEVEYRGRVDDAGTWPPPWPYVRMPLMAVGPITVRIERQRIYRRERPALYVEIVLPSSVIPDKPQVSNGELHGLTAGCADEVKALYAAAQTLYLDPNPVLSRVGHQPNQPNTLTGDPDEDLALARKWRELKHSDLLSWKQIAGRAAYDWRTVRRWVLWIESQGLGT